MKRIKGKKASHVGMVLSFVIFVTFLVFLYSIIQPATKTEKTKKDLVSFLKNELVNELSSDVTIATINTKSKNCIKIDFIPGTESFGFIAKDPETKKILESFSVDSKIIIKNNNAELVKVFFSEEFEKNSGEDESCEETYELGLVRTETYLFESKIKNMINNFKENYIEIKNKLKIPPGSEFGFSFIDFQGEVISTPEKEVSVDIYVEEIPIQYLDEQANIKSGFLSIKVW